MKITGILILIAFLHVSANGLTQTITLSFENAPLETVLKDIEKQTGYTFFYRTNWIKQAKKVTIKASNMPLQTALDLCFRDQPLTYTITGKIITVSPKEDKALTTDTKIEAGQTDLLVNIKGRVVSAKGEALARATVSIKGTDQATITNAEGEFFFNNVKEEAVLLISCVGYESVAMGVKGRSVVSAVLQLKAASLDEVQVIAYGTTTKRLNTGNVSTVKSEDIEKQPVTNPILALQGRVPGMFITQGTGLSGSGVKFQIRGMNSISNGKNPLFIIDGVIFPSENQFLINGSGFLGYSNETSGSPLNYVNPSDIESIEILKDADATAIYGSRGANGVILITTKKGKSAEFKFDCNIQSGWGKVARKIGLLNTREYLDMRYESFKNDGVTPNLNGDYDLTLWDTTRNTDWQKQLIGGTAKYRDIATTISGGNSQTKFLIGTGYHYETSVFPGNSNDRKGSVHINLSSISQNKKWKIDLSAFYTNDNNKLNGVDFTKYAIQLAPNAPPLFSDDGSLNWEPNSTGVSTWPMKNPASILYMKYKINADNLLSNLSLSYEIIPLLELKVSLGYNKINSNTTQTIPLISYDPSRWSTIDRSSYFSGSATKSLIVEPQISYAKGFKKITITSLIGATYQQTINVGESLEAVGFNSDALLEDIRSASKVTVLSANNSMYKYNALFARMNINADNKYLINITGRRDGTSRFGPANRFHNFGAIGIGWIFSKEKFIQKKSNILSYGKIRASYGITGSDQVGDYSYMDLFTTIPNIGIPYQGVPGITPNVLYNPDLAWEETKKIELGLEVGLLKDRVLLNISRYKNRSYNQLVYYSLPAITGFSTVRRNLNAIVQNIGWELQLNTTNINGKYFSWSSSINFSSNRNVLKSVSKGVSFDLERKVGHSLSSIFVFHKERVDPITGIYQFTDKDDKVVGKPDPTTDMNTLLDFTPKYYGGFQNTFQFKSFEMDILFQFVKSGKASLYLFSSTMPGSLGGAGSFGSNQPQSVLNRWQRSGDVKPIQRFNQNNSYLSSFSNVNQSDMVYGDASYIRLKNLAFGWNLPEYWKDKIGLKNAKLFIQGQNILTITKYQGLDPETQSSITLPPLRVITIGFKISV